MGLAGVRTRGVATRRWRARATGLAAGALLQLEHACLGAARRPPLSAGLLVSWTFHARAVQERCTCVCRVFNGRSPMPDSLPRANSVYHDARTRKGVMLFVSHVQLFVSHVQRQRRVADSTSRFPTPVSSCCLALNQQPKRMRQG